MVTVLVLFDVFFVTVDFSFSLDLESVVLVLDVFKFVVDVVESFSEFVVFVFDVVELLSEFVTFFLELLALLLLFIFVVLVVVLNLLVFLTETFVLFFPVTFLANGRVTELEMVSSLFGVVRHSDLHFVDVHSHLVFFFDSVFPFFDHAVFTFEIDVGLVLKKSDSFFELVDSVLVKFVHALHIVESGLHDHGVLALI